MQKLYTTILVLIFSIFQIQAQKHEPTSANPYGTANPSQPTAFADFAPMIGICDCKSVQRNPDGTWQDTTMIVWKYKYIFNGNAIQDITWKADSTYTSSIRQYQKDSARWVVTFFSYPGVTATPGTWLGGKSGDDIILKQPQKAPNGMDGVSRLTFYDISESGYKWKGEWVSSTGKFVYPFWTINCIKR
jgi:hypothetical protein